MIMNSDKRKYQKPIRYGNIVNPSDLSKSENSDPFSGDNSIEDKNFSPERKKMRKNSPKDFENLDLNEEYNRIQLYLAKSQKIGLPTSGSVKESQNVVESSGTIMPTENIINSEIDSSLLLKLYNNSVETLARLSVIEHNLVRNGFLKPIKVENTSIDQLQAIEAFMFANNMPLKALEHVEKFESNLQNASFKKTAVSIINWFICEHIQLKIVFCI